MTPHLLDLETPALLVDVDVLDRNLRAMADVARAAGVALRPHWKTHKCAELARRQLALGAVGGTVAKGGEAAVFLDAGFDDVLVATPVVDPRKIDRLLAARGDARVTVLVESEEGAARWSEAAARAGRTQAVVLEIDVGMGRTGALPGASALALARRLHADDHLDFRGVMTHAGHAYGAAPETLDALGRAEGETLVAVARAFEADGIPCPVVSVGSTPTARHAARVDGVTEIRPGNYLFHDGIQVALGVADEADCALTVLATVLARPSANRVVLDAGSKTLSSDRGGGVTMSATFGSVLGRPDHRLARLSEVHGSLETDDAAEYRIGQRVRIVPAHACATGDLHDECVGVRGEAGGDGWPVLAGGRVR
jgi:D-serine deaminase-like pyridoxal phosphate-dependent protein